MVRTICVNNAMKGFLKACCERTDNFFDWLKYLIQKSDLNLVTHILELEGIVSTVKLVIKSIFSHWWYSGEKKCLQDLFSQRKCYTA